MIDIRRGPRLIERSLQRGWHVTVQFTTEKRRDAVKIVRSTKSGTLASPSPWQKTESEEIQSYATEKGYK